MGPRVDGDYLPAEPEVLMAEGRHKATDVISGVASHEGGLFAMRQYPHLYSTFKIQHFRPILKFEIAKFSSYSHF